MNQEIVRNPIKIATVAVLIHSLVGTALAAEPTQLCTAAKEKAVGKAVACRLNAYGRAHDSQQLNGALDKCKSKLETGLAKADRKFASDCPTLDDATEVDDLANDLTRQLAAYLEDEAVQPSCQSAAAEAIFSSDTATQKCLVGRMKATAKSAACRMNAYAKFAKNGDPAALASALLRCSGRMIDVFSKLSDKYAAACPGNSDTTLIDDFIIDQLDPLTTYLSGSGTSPQCKVSTPTATSTPTQVPSSTPTAMPTYTPTDEPTDTPTDPAIPEPTDTPMPTPTQGPCGISLHNRLGVSSRFSAMTGCWCAIASKGR